MSYEIATSGLNAVDSQLDSISNNIANSGTVGYKSTTTQFSAMYSGDQMMGVSVSGTAQSITKGGSFLSTGSSLDLAIDGNGFFVTQDQEGNTFYTRAGSFTTDENGYLVDPNGNYVQGYAVDSNGNLEDGEMSNLEITGAILPAEATTNLKFAANLNAGDEAIDSSVAPFDPDNIDSYNDTYTTKVYDSLGNEHTVNQYFVKTGDDTWDVHYTFDGEAQDTVTTLTFDPNTGKLTSPTGPQTMTFPTDAAAPIEMTIDYSTCTQFGSDFSVTTNNADGYSSAQVNGVAVDEDGKVYATYSNGERMLEGQIVVAEFPSTSGLEAVSGTNWVETGDSGAPLIGTPGTGTTGTIESGVLEQSNVDITHELVDLMTAQRNYQANTKVISTDTQLDQALFQAM